MTRSMAMIEAIGSMEDLVMGSSLHTMQTGVEDSIILVEVRQVQSRLGCKSVVTEMGLAMMNCLVCLRLEWAI